MSGLVKFCVCFEFGSASASGSFAILRVEISHEFFTQLM